MKKLFAVLGDPIGHSMSPVMHNDLFSFYTIDAHYLPFQVKPADVEVAVKGLKAIGAAGFNVTIPHKSTIIPFLDEVDDLALSIGAVNTVVNEAGKLKGYNTDGLGFLKGLEAYFPTVSGKKVLIIGAGGAARAIYFTLAKYNPEVVNIANRTIERAARLVEDCPFPISSSAISLKEAEDHLGDYDLLIQTTMIGMYPKISEQPLCLSKLSTQAMVCDIIYNPFETQFLHEAKRVGAKVQNGVDMFVYQGALAFEKWTDIFPDVQRMRENVLKQLGGTLC
ncbi:shikimate dehydrogenase [Neobacillus ginsengisoli]|uniref:Shikimate dehydrogenase (NADP(+)) n=1 Tax=Neobacillus ginsengisoli TaxID=904295 RepID=A0ABT9XPL7_9BACI|nr:shikimate dehydrogenase [Neobacillus ginsengisoli]MDQ0197220.1 shikimate dehydrogenase [Neobacillus ginsengisoli]